jgi:hypothetical protein
LKRILSICLILVFVLAACQEKGEEASAPEEVENNVSEQEENIETNENEERTESVKTEDDKALTVDEYKNQVETQLNNLRQQFSDLMIVVDDFEDDTSLDDTSLTEVETLLGDINQLIDSISNLTPPNELEGDHELLLQGTNEFTFLTENFLTLIENKDENLYDEIGEAVSRGSEALSEAVVSLDIHMDEVDY